MTNKPLKPKSCKQCKQPFTPIRPLQEVCCFDCALAYTLILNVKSIRSERVKSRQETKEKLTKLKTKSEWLKEAQIEFNKYIRLRDQHLPCISCARFHAGQYHAGHYRTVGANPALRFNESNVNKQCAPCNNHLSGNIVSYRIGLVQKYGIKTVEWIEGKHEPQHYTIEQIKEIKTKYKNLCKQLKENQKMEIST